MNKIKVACFLSGPYRYADRVLEHIEKLLNNNGVDFDVYVHLWSSDEGVKSRKTEINISKLKDFDRVKKIFIEEAKKESEVIEYIQEKLGSFSYEEGNYIGHSPVNNVFGMFSGINVLMNYLENQGLKNDYTHIFRLRTDISIYRLKKDINIKVGEAMVSYNPDALDNLISDHSMITTVDDFYRIWNDSGDFIFRFAKSKYNPEIYLFEHFKGLGISAKKFLGRYRDYDVIYDEPKPSDSPFVKRLKQPTDAFALKPNLWEQLLVLNRFVKFALRRWV